MNIVEILPRFAFAGAERMVETLIYELKKQGHNVCAVSFFTQKLKITEDLEKSGVKIYFLDKKGGIDFTVMKKLKKIFSEVNPDVVHTHLSVSKYVIPVASKLKIPVVLHTVHSVADKELNFINKFCQNIFYKTRKLTPVAISETVRDTISKTYKLDSSKIPVVYNGINLSKCKVKTNYEINEKIKIIHIGRFVPLKNQKLLVLAVSTLIKNYPNINLEFVGSGETFEEVKLLVKELNLENSVEFLGEQTAVYEFLHSADIFILPSVYEGMPMTIIEAMGTGLPIIASNVGGIKDMLKSEENALLIEPTVDEIVTALSRLILDKTLREKLGISALKRSEDFSATKMAEGYLKLFGGKKC